MNPSDDQSGSGSSVNSQESLQQEVDSLRERLREAQETLDAIRNGDVDAVIVTGADAIPRVYTLETADQTYRLLVEEMQEGALTVTQGGDILYCNRRLAQLIEAHPERIIGGSLKRYVAAEDWPRALELISAESKGELGIQTEASRVIPAHVSFSRIRGEDLGEGDIYCCIVTDLTEQRRSADELREAHAALVAQVSERERTERLLRQSQKMEAIGQLTGGIAHDFNNLLMVITGGLSILDLSPAPERRKKIGSSMRQAAERGASLTRQLLAFSRQKELHPTTIAIPQQVGGMQELLDRSLGGTISVTTEFAADLWPVCVDPGELEIAVLNLCVNARDAMPGGGKITIAAANHTNIQEYGLSGDFVELSITDTGEGMDADTIARCLEPFYTTKDIGKGTGLGLAQVYGFTQGSEGSIHIESKPKLGTRVSLYLPRSQQAPQIRSSERGTYTAAAMPHPKCKVLLVEDDPAVAALTSDMLKELGYEVLQVSDARAGLRAMSGDHGVEMILSDVMMPGGMDGVGFVRELRRRHVELPIVLVTGMPDAVRREAETAGISLLAKPYQLADLAANLNTALQRQKHSVPIQSMYHHHHTE
jgi:PAS domain S-box-containing protein